MSERMTVAEAAEISSDIACLCGMRDKYGDSLPPGSLEAIQETCIRLLSKICEDGQGFSSLEVLDYILNKHRGLQ